MMIRWWKRITIITYSNRSIIRTVLALGPPAAEQTNRTWANWKHFRGLQRRNHYWFWDCISR